MQLSGRYGGYGRPHGITYTEEVAGSSPVPPTVAKLCFAYRRMGNIIPFSIYLMEHVSLDTTVERFFASLRFEQRGKLEQLGIEISFID